MYIATSHFLIFFVHRLLECPSENGKVELIKMITGEIKEKQDFSLFFNQEGKKW